MTFHFRARFKIWAFRLPVLVLTALLTSPSNSAEQPLSWIEPTQNTDGSPLTDLASYDIWHGCSQSGVYTSIETLLAPASTYTVKGLPDVGTCYFAAKAINAQGVSSRFNTELVKTFGTVELPGPVTDTQIVWRESSVMGGTFVAAGTLGAGNGSVVPGLPVGWAEDDIFLLHIEGEGEDANADGQGDFGGTLIGTVASDENGASYDTRHTLYWKRATASESAPTVDDAGNHTLAVITAWRGLVATGSPIHQSQSSSEGGGAGDRNLDVTATGLTTSIADALIVISVSTGDNTTISGWTNANLVSITEAFDVGADAGSNGSLHAAYGILASAGATGDTTATLANSEMDANWVIALKPADGGEPAAAAPGRHTIDGGMNPIQGGMQ